MNSSRRTTMAQQSRSGGSSDLVTDVPELTLEDLCESCRISETAILEYVAEGIVKPHGRKRVEWRFSCVSVIEVRRALRLERDLGLNPAGVALALQLMDEIEDLKARLARAEGRMSGGTD